MGRQAGKSSLLVGIWWHEAISCYSVIKDSEENELWLRLEGQIRHKSYNGCFYTLDCINFQSSFLALSESSRN